MWSNQLWIITNNDSISLGPKLRAVDSFPLAQTGVNSEKEVIVCICKCLMLQNTLIFTHVTLKPWGFALPLKEKWCPNSSLCGKETVRRALNCLFDGDIFNLLAKSLKSFLDEEEQSCLRNMPSPCCGFIRLLRSLRRSPSQSSQNHVGERAYHRLTDEMISGGSSKFI